MAPIYTWPHSGLGYIFMNSPQRSLPVPNHSSFGQQSCHQASHISASRPAQSSGSPVQQGWAFVQRGFAVCPGTSVSSSQGLSELAPLQLSTGPRGPKWPRWVAEVIVIIVRSAFHPHWAQGTAWASPLHPAPQVRSQQPV